MAVETFNTLIAKNKRNSFLLIALFIIFMSVFGIIIGLVWSGGFGSSGSSSGQKVNISQNNRREYYKRVNEAKRFYAKRGIKTKVNEDRELIFSNSGKKVDLRKFGYDRNYTRRANATKTNWAFAFMVAGITATLSFIFAMIAMFSGGEILMASTGARQIYKADDPQLYNVVEEICLAGGLPVPKIYIIDSHALNAFATGKDPKSASIAITIGLREKLTRDELQAVMAHELSHVKHYDIRYAMLMAVLVGTIVLLSEIFLRSLWFGGGSRRRDDREGGGAAQIILVVVAILLAILAPILAKIIQLAMSRQREFLADAGAVKLTRNPAAMCSALLKLSSVGNEFDKANKATAGMFTVDPYHHDINKTEQKGSIFDTHPPIAARVKRLRQLI